VFRKLIEGIPQEETSKYDRVIKEIGDGVRDYQALKEFKTE